MLRSPEDVAVALLAGLVSKGGATAAARVNDAVPESGFVSAVAGHGFVVPFGDVAPYDVVSWVERERVLLSEPGVFAGAWFDRESGLVCFDVVRVFERVESARFAGRFAGREVCVFDLAAGVEVA